MNESEPSFKELKAECKKRWGHLTAFRIFLLLTQNRWLAFSDEELALICGAMRRQMPKYLSEELDTELERRKRQKP